MGAILFFFWDGWSAAGEAPESPPMFCFDNNGRRVTFAPVDRPVCFAPVDRHFCFQMPRQ